MAIVHTSCRICVQRCGIAVTVEDNRAVHIGPDKENPFTWRDFCVKGRSANELVKHPRRVTSPMSRTQDGYRDRAYAEAIPEIAAAVRDIINEHGPDAIGFYYGNPVGFDSAGIASMTRFIRAIGTKNIYNWGSVDTNAKHVVSGEMYGTTLFPLIPDVDDCDCFLFIGANPAASKMNWTTTVPDGWRRIRARVTRGADLIVLDPYRTETASVSTRHVRVLPGADWAFLLGMLKVIFADSLEDNAACAAEHGADRIRQLAGEASLERLACRAGVEPNDIVEVARMFARARTAMAIARTGVSQTSGGTLALWLTEVLNIVTGRWDRPGCRYFQPGYLGSGLTPHDPEPHLSRVGGRPAIAGAHSLQELPAEIGTPGPGQIRALFVSYGNPVVSGPDGAALDSALASLELLVSVDMIQRESHRHSHWLIPGTHWLERGELSPYTSGTNELPFAQFSRQAVEPPAGVRYEWEFYEDLGHELGLPRYGPDDPPFDPERSWQRLIERGGLATWAEVRANPHGVLLGDKEYGHARSALLTPDRRIRLAPDVFVQEARRRLAESSPVAPTGFPFRLGNRRRLSSMNSFLNDLPGSRRLVSSNQVEINRDDAAPLGLGDGDRVVVRSATGAIELVAAVTDAPRPGVVIVEHGWGSRVFDPRAAHPPQSYGANRNLLTGGTEEDPLSQMSAFNETWVRIEPLPPNPDRVPEDV